MELEKFWTKKILGQSQTTSLFFSGQRLKAGTLSFPPLPYTFAVQKERLSDGVKDTKGKQDDRRKTRERNGQLKRCTACTPGQTQAVCYKAKICLRYFAPDRQCSCRIKGLRVRK